MKSTQVWKYLCRHPHQSLREIAAGMEWDSNCVSHTLRRLANQGCAKGTGNTWNRTWVATEHKPVDTRGLNPNSTRGRMLGAMGPHCTEAARAKIQELAGTGLLRHKKHSNTGKPKFKPATAGKITLEQFWTFPITTASPYQSVLKSVKPAASGHCCQDDPIEQEAA